jgi:radial spoke head protein 4A
MVLFMMLVLSEWIKLPQISPEQIKISRLINPMLSGNLDAKINSFPAFPGTEKHLLKAMIIRITFGSVIAPKGLFKTNEEKGKALILETEIEYEEEFKMPEMAELSTVENWVHLNPSVLQSGRVAHFVDNANEEERQ